MVVTGLANYLEVDWKQIANLYQLFNQVCHAETRPKVKHFVWYTLARWLWDSMSWSSCKQSFEYNWKRTFVHKCGNMSSTVRFIVASWKMVIFVVMVINKFLVLCNYNLCYNLTLQFLFDNLLGVWALQSFVKILQIATYVVQP